MADQFNVYSLPPASMTVDVSEDGVVPLVIEPITYRLRMAESRNPLFKNGTVILSRPLISGETLSIERKTPITNDTNFQELEEPDWNMFEYQLDKLTMVEQEIEGHACDCRGVGTVVPLGMAGPVDDGEQEASDSAQSITAVVEAPETDDLYPASNPPPKFALITVLGDPVTTTMSGAEASDFWTIPNPIGENAPTIGIFADPPVTVEGALMPVGGTTSDASFESAGAIVDAGGRRTVPYTAKVRLREDPAPTDPTVRHVYTPRLGWYGQGPYKQQNGATSQIQFASGFVVQRTPRNFDADYSAIAPVGPAGWKGIGGFSAYVVDPLEPTVTEVSGSAAQGNQIVDVEFSVTWIQPYHEDMVTGGDFELVSTYYPDIPRSFIAEWDQFSPSTGAKVTMLYEVQDYISSGLAVDYGVLNPNLTWIMDGYTNIRVPQFIRYKYVKTLTSDDPPVQEPPVVNGDALGDGGGSGGDPNFQDVSLLLPMDGAEVTDSSNLGNPITMNGDVSLDTERSKSGGVSLKVPNSAPGNYLTLPNSTALLDTGGDFSIQFWYLPAPFITTSDFGGAVSTWDPIAGTGLDLYMAPRSIGFPSVVKVRAELYIVGASGDDIVYVRSSAIMEQNQWYFVEATVSNGVAYIFIDGVLADSSPVTPGVDGGGSEARIGGFGEGNSSMKGWIDELRITNGVGRNTSNYTPPTTTFPG